MDSGTVAEQKITLCLFHLWSQHSCLFPNPRLSDPHLIPLPTCATYTSTKALNNNWAFALVSVLVLFQKATLAPTFSYTSAFPNFCQSLPILYEVTWGWSWVSHFLQWRNSSAWLVHTLLSVPEMVCCCARSPEHFPSALGPVSLVAWSQGLASLNAASLVISTHSNLRLTRSWDNILCQKSPLNLLEQLMDFSESSNSSAKSW